MNAPWPNRGGLSHHRAELPCQDLEAPKHAPGKASQQPSARRKPFVPDLPGLGKKQWELELARLERENAEMRGKVHELTEERKEFKALIGRYEELLFFLSKKHGFVFKPLMDEWT